MIPYSRVHVGDVYQNPLTLGEWLVLDKEDSDKMVQVVLMTKYTKAVQPIWVKTTHRMFRYNLVQKGT